MFRDIAARRPGHISRVGMGTFVDPRNGGGKLNARTTEDLVELVTLGGQQCLFYKTFPIDVGIIRATTGDPDGNLTMEKEALTLEALAIAMAAHNSGGIVIAQVERVAESGSLNPRQVKIPGILVDCVVVAKPENHWQTFGTQYNPAFSSEIRVRAGSLPPMPMSERKIIARRAAFELKANSVVNLGIGMPDGIAAVANEERIIDLITLTAEPGTIGGIPASGIDFGAAINTQAVIDQPYQFDFYDGGGLDAAFLGLAQVDRAGNLNVSKFGPKLAGAGGFINISQNAKKVIFVGTFGAGKLRIALSDGKLAILEEARARKFVEAVEHVTFSGAYATARGQGVLYVTERCVFALRPDGLELIEVAPGIDIERDILALMDFKPLLPRDPIGMDPRIFREGAMDLREHMLAIPLDQRFTLDEQQNLFFVNLGVMPCAAAPTSTPSPKSSRPGSAGSAGASTPSSTTTISRSCRSCWMSIPPWCEASPTASTRASRAIPPRAFCASSSAKPWNDAVSPRIFSKARKRRSRTGETSPGSAAHRLSSAQFVGRPTKPRVTPSQKSTAVETSNCNVRPAVQIAMITSILQQEGPPCVTHSFSPLPHSA
jgi:propionate CoA-transferase